MGPPGLVSNRPGFVLTGLLYSECYIENVLGTDFDILCQKRPIVVSKETYYTDFLGIFGRKAPRCLLLVVDSFCSCNYPAPALDSSYVNLFLLYFLFF